MVDPGIVTADAKQVDSLPSDVRIHLKNVVKPRLEADPFFGDRIRRAQWPKAFRNLPNLFRLELPRGHRGVYAVLTYPGRLREIRIVWLGNHKRYDRLFGYATS